MFFIQNMPLFWDKKIFKQKITLKSALFSQKMAIKVVTELASERFGVCKFSWAGVLVEDMESRSGVRNFEDQESEPFPLQLQSPGIYGIIKAFCSLVLELLIHETSSNLASFIKPTLPQKGIQYDTRKL